MEIYDIHNTGYSTLIHDSAAQTRYQESFVFMDESEYELFEERAAIIEYDGKLSRKEAEKLAYRCIMQYRKIYARAS